MKVISKNNEYEYLYSLNGGTTFKSFTTTPDDLIICRTYIGGNLGIYASSNGQNTKEYADFDWVKYQGFTRQ